MTSIRHWSDEKVSDRCLFEMDPRMFAVSSIFLVLTVRYQTDSSIFFIKMQSVYTYPDKNVHLAYMGPTWVLSAPGGPHVGPMNLTIRAYFHNYSSIHTYWLHRYIHPCMHTLYIRYVQVVPLWCPLFVPTIGAIVCRLCCATIRLIITN